MSAPYIITRARYAKGSVAVHCPSTTGFKTRAARLAEALKGRWSNREGAYIMSESKGDKFKELYAEGWDGEIMQTKLVPPRHEESS